MPRLQLVATTRTNPFIYDRVAALAGVKVTLRHILEAGEEDGWTPEKLLSYLQDVEELVADCRCSVAGTTRTTLMLVKGGTA
ncbi:MAG: hypothetical protein EOO38_23605 [Cytophagaceae bacterium]|nr:MAG: hypothetical protein EOO38_23605 [Cytophagaceae bacterium]